jgi:hypothetical protein
MVMTDIQEKTESRNAYVRRFDDVAPARRFSRISWSGVFSGSAFGLVFQLWLAFLGVAIGASTIDPLREARPLSGIGAGSLVWLGISIVVSSLIGGWIAGRFSGSLTRSETAAHGAIAWAVSNAAMFALVGTVFGAMATGAVKLTGNAAEAAGRAADSGIANRAADQAADSGAMNQAMNQAEQSVNNLIDQGRAEVQSGQAEARARQAGETAAEATAAAGWGVVILMALGLISGILGAAMAAPKYMTNRTAVR